MKKRKEPDRTVLVTEDGKTRIVVHYNKDDPERHTLAVIEVSEKTERGGWKPSESVALPREAVSDVCIALGASLYEE